MQSYVVKFKSVIRPSPWKKFQKIINVGVRLFWTVVNKWKEISQNWTVWRSTGHTKTCRMHATNLFSIWESTFILQNIWWLTVIFFPFANREKVLVTLMGVFADTVGSYAISRYPQNKFFVFLFSKIEQF